MIKLITFVCLLSFFNIGRAKINDYGERYGIDWIFFPDGNGHPHFVNLSINPDDMLSTRSANINKKIEFRLYTRDNLDVYEVLNKKGKAENEICKNGCFKRNAPVKLITHGWMSAEDRSSVMLIKNAYLKKYDYNIIGVDWSSISMNYLYPLVAKQVKYVGKSVATFLKVLSETFGVKGEQIHLIGHSLGAHVMGNAASSSGLNISRITGLDPARPLFEYPMQDTAAQLDPNDAKFVDIVHTCSGVLGVAGQYGHVDFFPNNGVPPQPGCKGFQAMFEACSHGRAHAYFAEAIENPQGFPAHKCEDWNSYITNTCDKDTTVYMGEDVDKKLRGSYYLTTNPYRPFAVNA